MRSFSPRTRLSAIIATVAVLGGAFVGAAVGDLHLDGPSIKASERLMANFPKCFGEQVTPAFTKGGPQACAHSDAAPPGVDVNKPVSTAVLEARKGGLANAVKAAQEQGVPVPASLATVTDRVKCDGDGTSGYRVQAIYVVTSDKANRYPAVSDQIKQWAAGVDSVFALSAAKTGGIRNVRWVTAPNGDGTCSPTVLNVTLPAGSFASFNATISAMYAQGFTSSARKYSLWVDGTGQCGIAQTYMTSDKSQGNTNNGYAPQFARTDTACWGSPYSVEAHELSHTLGSVQGDAPHTTKAGHCWDEADRMCYSDGGTHAMVQVCPGDQEPLFDCNDDDYYSTYPPAGSYLDTHWNTADSRFLIGGGDGSGGGSAGVPTRLGGTMQINNPAIPGVATAVQATPDVVPGRTVQASWTTTRKDCVFGDASATQTTLMCDAPLTTPAPVTLTMTDSAGDKVVRTGSLTFDKTPRALAPAIRMDGTATATYQACLGGNAIMSSKVTDAASGAPVKGVTVSFFRKVGTAAPVKVGTAITGVDGIARNAGLAQTAGDLSATTTGLVWFPTKTSSATTVTTIAGPCPTSMTGGPASTTTMAGTPVALSGTMTKTVAGVTSPAAGEPLGVFTNKPGTTVWTRVGTAVTTETGTWTGTVTLLDSANVKVAPAAKAAYAQSSTVPALITVSPWVTAATVTATPTTVMAAAPVTVTGTLTQQDTAGTVSPLAKAPVTVTYPIEGGKSALVTATTTAVGTFSVSVKPTGTGTVTVKYVGKPGWPAATASTALTVNRWATTTTVNLAASTVMAGTPVKVAGTVTQRDAGGVTTALASGPVSVTYPTATGTAIARTATAVNGTFTVTIVPTGSGTVTAAYAGKAGWDVSNATAALTANPWTTTTTSAVSATSVAPLAYVKVSGTVTQRDAGGASKAFASAPVTISYKISATRTLAVTTMTNSVGAYTFSIRPGATGPVTVTYLGKPGWGSSAAAPITVTVS